MNVLKQKYWGSYVLNFTLNWGWAMFLRCSYFFGNLSLNVLINMVLTQIKECRRRRVTACKESWKHWHVQIEASLSRQNVLGTKRFFDVGEKKILLLWWERQASSSEKPYQTKSPKSKTKQHRRYRIGYAAVTRN